jgi:hypothetical protein
MTDPHPTKPILDQGFDACVAKLTDFGYTGITPEMIRAAHTNWLAGGKADDIIENFAFGDFDKYPQIFGIKNGKPAA